MKTIKFLLTLGFIFILNNTNFGQPLGLNWLRCYGTNQHDLFRSNTILRNGNIVSIGNKTNYTGGTLITSSGTSDCKVLCTNKLGVTIWEKTFGGSNDDAFSSSFVDTSIDGNILIGFNSRSTDNTFSTNFGFEDVFVYKLSPTGNVIWSKNFGGTNGEYISQLRGTNDGGSIVMMQTGSSLSGNLTQINHGMSDIWIIKLDSNGNIQWQKLYGGSSNDCTSTPDGSIIVTPDGGYLFTAGTESTNGDLSGIPTFGGIDIWLVKINSVGVIQWQKIIGGTGVDQVPKLYSQGNSIYMSLYSNSSDGDFIGMAASDDVAIFKMNQTGTIIWKKKYGSTSTDGVSNITGLNNDLITVSFSTYSFNSFSGFSFTNWGINSIALLSRIDTLNGNIKWMKPINGTEDDIIMDLKISTDSLLFGSGFTRSNNYDIYGNQGFTDGFLVSFSNSNFVKGLAFIDNNNNSLYDVGEKKLNYLKIGSKKGNVNYAETITSNGNFTIEVDTGTYSTKPVYNASYYTNVPDSFNCNFSTNGQVFLDSFAIKAIPNIKDLRIDMFPIDGVPRPGGTLKYHIVAYNVGTQTISSGNVSLKKDPRVNFLSYDITPNFILGDSVSWNFSNLAPFDSLKYFVKVTFPIPPILIGGEFIKHKVQITPIINDSVPLDNTLFLNHRVVNSFDPNLKMNLIGDSISTTEIQNNRYINYVIQFQNTGTAPALDVVIIDTFENKYIPNSIELLSVSHPVNFSLKNNIATWRFNNINLIDSTTNEPKSHGHISFKIRVKNNLQSGDKIKNRASIYFDYNYPIHTEIDSITVFSPPITPPVITPAGNLTYCDSNLVLKSNYSVGNQWYRNGILLNGEIKDSLIVNSNGNYSAKYMQGTSTSNFSNATNVLIYPTIKPVISFSQNKLIVSPTNYNNIQWYYNNVLINGAIDTFYIPNTNTGVYSVWVYNNVACTKISNPYNYVFTSINTITNNNIDFNLYPNPTKNKICNLVLPNFYLSKVELKLYNLKGQLVFYKKIVQGNSIINFTNIASGIYIVELSGNKKKSRTKFFVD